MLAKLCFRADFHRYDHVAIYDDDSIKKIIKKSKLARQPTRSSAGPVCYSPVPAQGRLRRRLQTQSGTLMASARRRESTINNAMAVEIDLQSSGNRDSSDDNGEAPVFSPSPHKKEMLEHKYNDDNDNDGAFSQTESEGPPEVDSSSSGDDVQDHQDSQDFIRESAELSESDGAK
jgi:hypothetical protein